MQWLLGLVCAAAKEQESKVAKLTPAELAHKRHFWSIGEGFEGSASDWTEYVVWLIGVIGVFYYLMNPNARRNLHAVRTHVAAACARAWQGTRHRAFGLSANGPPAGRLTRTGR